VFDIHGIEKKQIKKLITKKDTANSGFFVGKLL
jgi:hypothetical protein